LLVSLGLVDDDIEDKELKFANVDSLYSIEGKENIDETPGVKHISKKG
jgi:hypothetical protein